jgi:hypothetical protein
LALLGIDDTKPLALCLAEIHQFAVVKAIEFSILGSWPASHGKKPVA